MSQSVISNRVQHIEVPEARDGQRLDNFLANTLKGLPKSAIYRIIRTGQVRINGGRCKPADRLLAGDDVRVPPVRTHEKGNAVISEAVKAEIASRTVYQDGDMLVLDKPAGMAVHGGSGLAWGVVDVVRQLYPYLSIDLVHRLDRDTSGCLVLACNGPALNDLSRQFRDGEVGKFYLCLVNGRVGEDFCEVNAPLAAITIKGEKRIQVDDAGKSALTRFRVLQRFDDATFVEAELLTGRTHQIRVHAAHLGHSLAGDRKYASADSLKQWKERGLNRLFLHAARMMLTDQKAEGQVINAPLASELKVVLDNLEQ